VYKLQYHYDEMLKKVPYKYAIPILVGKRSNTSTEPKPPKRTALLHTKACTKKKPTITH